ncbi:MAG: PilZ domain-containing protein [Deltaproteobacteria bacterium]|nr:PilZ domain-containing protein [Deltaproteobacteria bacterium]
MEKSKSMKDRRKSQRMILDLPLEYHVMDVPYAHGGLVVNASELGLLVQSVKNLPIGTKLNIAVLFPKGFELANFEVLAEILWKDLHWEEDWEGYQYGLRFLQILDNEYWKLKQVLSGQFHLEEVPRNYR